MHRFNESIGLKSLTGEIWCAKIFLWESYDVPTIVSKLRETTRSIKKKRIIVLVSHEREMTNALSLIDPDTWIIKQNHHLVRVKAPAFMYLRKTNQLF